MDLTEVGNVFGPFTSCPTRARIGDGQPAATPRPGFKVIWPREGSECLNMETGKTP